MIMIPATMDESDRRRIEDNWHRVRDEVSEAARTHGRAFDEVQIIGVSKYVDLETTVALVESGCVTLGESRPQQMWQKAEARQWPDQVRWHLIGHLQRNKIRRTLRHQPVIQSVDSERLLNAIAEEAVARAWEIDVLLEVNISEDEAKTGFAPHELADVITRLPESGVTVSGLMAMAGWGTAKADAQAQFAATRRLHDELKSQTGLPLPELSMGMSGDFREAIAEGATMVRIGSRLFEGLPGR